MRTNTCFIAMMFFVFLFSCQKDSIDAVSSNAGELNIENSDISIEAARSQYELHRSKARLVVDGKVKYKIDWSKGKKQKTPKGVSLLNIPISVEDDGTRVEFNFKGSSAKNLDKSLLRFFATLNKDGSYNFQIVHLIPDENYKAKSGKKIDGKMSGYIIVRDIDDELIGNYRMEKGKMVGGGLKSDSSKGRLSSGCNATVITYNYGCISDCRYAAIA